MAIVLKNLGGHVKFEDKWLAFEILKNKRSAISVQIVNLRKI